MYGMPDGPGADLLDVDLIVSLISSVVKGSRMLLYQFSWVCVRGSYSFSHWPRGVLVISETQFLKWSFTRSLISLSFVMIVGSVSCVMILSSVIFDWLVPKKLLIILFLS